MAKSWSADDVLGMARAFQAACVLAAAADLDLFGALDDGPMTPSALAGKLGTDPRATTVLMDALAGMELLHKKATEYVVPADVAALLTEGGSRSVLPMVQHHANCLRRWAQLTEVTTSGKPAERRPSVRGEAADQAAFIGGMHVLCDPIADGLVVEVGPPAFRHVLDVGGASGTWTKAWLRAVPEATATIFDLPDVIPMARQRMAEAGLADRVTFVAGDFYADDLPAGADLVWLSAIAHQNSREQNRNLFARIRRALTADGALLLRDVVMDETRTWPAGGAMFAVNMLVATEGGGTYTFNEYRQDLAAVGFDEVTLVRQDEWMNSVIRAARGEQAARDGDGTR